MKNEPYKIILISLGFTVQHMINTISKNRKHQSGIIMNFDSLMTTPKAYNLSEPERDSPDLIARNDVRINLSSMKFDSLKSCPFDQDSHQCGEHQGKRNRPK